MRDGKRKDTDKDSNMHAGTEAFSLMFSGFFNVLIGSLTKDSAKEL